MTQNGDLRQREEADRKSSSALMALNVRGPQYVRLARRVDSTRVRAFTSARCLFGLELHSVSSYTRHDVED